METTINDLPKFKKDQLVMCNCQWKGENIECYGIIKDYIGDEEYIVKITDIYIGDSDVIGNSILVYGSEIDIDDTEQFNRRKLTTI